MEPALFQCWHTVYDAGPTIGQRCRIRPTINDARCTSQQTRDVDLHVYSRPTCQVGIAVLGQVKVYCYGHMSPSIAHAL